MAVYEFFSFLKGFTTLLLSACYLTLMWIWEEIGGPSLGGGVPPGEKIRKAFMRGKNLIFDSSSISPHPDPQIINNQPLKCPIGEIRRDTKLNN